MKYNWNIHDSGDPDDYCWYNETELAFVSIFRNRERTGFHVYFQVNKHPISLNHEPLETFEKAEDCAMEKLTKFIDECTRIKAVLKGDAE